MLLLDSGPLFKELEIRLKQSEDGLYGRVLDDVGKPVERFELVFRGASVSDPEHTLFIRGFEGNEGLFSVTDVPAGTYQMQVRALPYGPMGSTPIQNIVIEKVEIRRGYLFGELVLQLPPRQEVKK